MGEKVKRTLLIKGHNEEAEIDFELQYLLSLNVRERFMLMEKKSKEMKNLLVAHGHGRTPGIIKRK
ncbi:MAG: hypothetical protein GY950_31350 [bacterium]|nr:hypothetical protein [bacterium]